MNHFTWIFHNLLSFMHFMHMAFFFKNYIFVIYLEKVLIGFDFLIKQLFYKYTFASYSIWKQIDKAWGKIYFMRLEKNCSLQWKLGKISNIILFCNKFKGIMNPSLIMDEYSTIVNGLPRQFNVQRISYFYLYSNLLWYSVNLSLNSIIWFSIMMTRSRTPW